LNWSEAYPLFGIWHFREPLEVRKWEFEMPSSEIGQLDLNVWLDFPSVVNDR